MQLQRRPRYVAHAELYRSLCRLCGDPSVVSTPRSCRMPPQLFPRHCIGALCLTGNGHSRTEMIRQYIHKCFLFSNQPASSAEAKQVLCAHCRLFLYATGLGSHRRHASRQLPCGVWTASQCRDRLQDGKRPKHRETMIIL